MATTTRAIEAEVIEEKPMPLARRSAALEERSVEDVLAHVQKIQQVMASVLKDGEHYGVIPGTDRKDGKPPKKTLLQPGAQTLGFVFRLVPEYIIERRELPNGHREYEIRCELIHAPSGSSAGQGVGSCSTMESKYRWRQGERACPACGADTIKRSKFEDNDGSGKGWYCYAKIGGCGAKFAENDPVIVSQEVGRKENPDVADVYNTVLKMAKKRAFVDATITATAAGDIFTQDLEDTAEAETGKAEPKREANAGPTQSRTRPPDASTPSEAPKAKSAPKLSSANYTEVWSRAKAQAKETGATDKTIINDVLAYLKLPRLDEVGQDYPRLLKLIDGWEPGVDFASMEKD